MADVYGRLTGNAGVCLATLGRARPTSSPASPTPTSTARRWSRSPGRRTRAPAQGVAPVHGHGRADAADHQVERARRDAVVIPRSVRKAFKVAEAEKPGACHIEVPEDVAAAEVEPHCSRALPRRPSPEPPALHRRAVIIEAALPVIFAGNGVIRGGASPELRDFSRAHGIPVVDTFMAKGLMPTTIRLALRTAGLQARDYLLRLREGRPDHRGRLRPGRVLARVLEPGAQEAHHPHRLHPRRGGRALPARGRGGRRRARGARAAQRLRREGPRSAAPTARCARP